ncbi:hypothetical protein L2E82_10408 [Cichorium intybus]|uniref:Uncharacterized protein n=1 Tax=Cichorium intybus TaxID=13427 RepID=A0ACB9GAD2_CICIN|nr:hypothetical protein L2E82_10408 [Cichorium intybus]
MRLKAKVDEANFVEDGSPVKKPKTESVNLVSDCENSDDLFFKMPYLGGNWDTSSVDAFLNRDSVQLEPYTAGGGAVYLTYTSSNDRRPFDHRLRWEFVHWFSNRQHLLRITVIVDAYNHFGNLWGATYRDDFQHYCCS